MGERVSYTRRVVTYRHAINVPTNGGPLVIPNGPDLYEQDVDQSIRENARNISNLVGAWVTLLADSPLSSSNHFKPARLYRTFYGTLRSDLYKVIKRYSQLFDTLTHNLVHEEDGTSIGPFLTEFKETPIFQEYLNFYRTRNPRILQFITTFLLFGKRVYVEKEELGQVAFRDWLNLEEKLANQVAPAWVLTLLRQILRPAFHDFTASCFPKHGPGTVAEPGTRGSMHKNAAFTYEAKIAYLFREYATGVSPDRILPDGGLWKTNIHGHARNISTRSSVLMFVPKDWKKARSICKEPVVYQWAQQAVRLDFQEAIANSIFGHHIYIGDQSVNRDAAQFGSESSLVDTIDLSSASDSLSLKVVRDVFPPRVLKYLLGTRSSSADLPDGRTVKLHKFAPMGSALCFPVQSVVYAAICIAAAVIHDSGFTFEQLDEGQVSVGYTQHKHALLFNRSLGYHIPRYQPFYCYGDDIVCDTRTTSIVMELLRRLGFTVNTGKSYVGDSCYRESCGGHYFDGYDVTPLPYKIGKIEREVSITTLAGFIDTCNRCLEYGFLNLRRFLKNFCLYHPVMGVRGSGGHYANSVLFSTRNEDSVALLSIRPNLNTHLRRRECRDLQRDEVRSICVKPNRIVPYKDVFDPYWYNLWQRSRLSEKEAPSEIQDGFPKDDSIGTRAGWRWTPT